MDERTFQSMMLRARTLAHLDVEHADYWTGYQRGLRRHYHGERFGTDEEHAQWMAMADAPDRTRADRGRGYRDGFAGRAPSIQLGDSGLLGDLPGETRFTWRTDAASGELLACNVDEALATLVRDGEWAEIGSDREARDIADGAWLTISEDGVPVLRRGLMP